MDKKKAQGYTYLLKIRLFMKVTILIILSNILEENILEMEATMKERLKMEASMEKEFYLMKFKNLFSKLHFIITVQLVVMNKLFQDVYLKEISNFSIKMPIMLIHYMKMNKNKTSIIQTRRKVAMVKKKINIYVKNTVLRMGMIVKCLLFVTKENYLY